MMKIDLQTMKMNMKMSRAWFLKMRDNFSYQFEEKIFCHRSLLAQSKIWRNSNISSNSIVKQNKKDNRMIFPEMTLKTKILKA